MQAEPDNLALHCPNCWYNLTGLPGNRCPECGHETTLQEIKDLGEDFKRAVTPLSARKLVRKMLIVPVVCWGVCLLMFVLSCLSVLGDSLVVLNIILVTLGFVRALFVACDVAAHFVARLSFRAGQPLTSGKCGVIFALFAVALLLAEIGLSLAVPMFVLAVLTGLGRWLQ